MGVVGKANWSFSSSDGNHIIAASVETTFTHFVLHINVDGIEVMEQKKLSKWGIFGEYPFRAGQHVGLLKVSSKGLIGCNLQLTLDGKPVMPGQHAVLATPAPAPAPAPTMPPPPAPASPASVSVLPVLPSYCGSCGAPVSMNDVHWTGPMSAACGRCGSPVQVEWKKIG